MTVKTQDIDAFIRSAAQAAHDITPPTVFIPANLRRSKRRLVTGGKAVLPGPTDEIRIASSDPVSFLIAVMQGGPIPCFQITDHGARANATVTVSYEIPTLEHRIKAAHSLRSRLRIDKPKGDADEYAEMIGRAAQAADQDDQSSPPYTDDPTSKLQDV